MKSIIIAHNLCAICKIELTKKYIETLYNIWKRINQTIRLVRKKIIHTKNFKNQSKKLLQRNLIWIIIIKFKNLKIFHVFIITFYVESEKIWYIVCKKQNITSDFVAVCYKCIKYLTFW